MSSTLVLEQVKFVTALVKVVKGHGRSCFIGVMSGIFIMASESNLLSCVKSLSLRERRALVLLEMSIADSTCSPKNLVEASLLINRAIVIGETLADNKEWLYNAPALDTLAHGDLLNLWEFEGTVRDIKRAKRNNPDEWHLRNIMITELEILFFE